MLASMLDKKNINLSFGQQDFIFSGLGGVYWPQKKLLMVADLHLEKGSYFAMRGNPLPLYDTFDTLKRLQQLVRFFKPQKLVSLGDNIHDPHAFKRMSEQNYQLLRLIAGEVTEWVWLLGNHDQKIMPEALTNVVFGTDFTHNNITLAHEFMANKAYQIVGHYHPKVTVNGVRGPCLVMNEQKMILPSFGSYTGGLDINSSDFKTIISQEKFQAYLIYQEKVWRVK